MLIYDNIQVNAVNVDGHSPLSLALMGKSPPKLTEDTDFANKTIYQLLIRAGANVNIVYPEDSHRKKPLKKDNKEAKSAEEEKEYKCSILINYIRHNHLKMEDMVCTLSYLMTNGATFDVVDSKYLKLKLH